MMLYMASNSRGTTWHCSSKLEPSKAACNHRLDLALLSATPHAMAIDNGWPICKSSGCQAELRAQQ